MHRVPFEEHWAHSHSCLEACCWQNTHLLLMRIPLKRGTALHEVLLFPRSSLHTLINWCWKWRLAPLLKLWRRDATWLGNGETPLCLGFFIHKRRGLSVSPLRSLSANFSQERTGPLAAAVSGFGPLHCTVLPVEQREAEVFLHALWDKTQTH